MWSIEQVFEFKYGDIKKFCNKFEVDKQKFEYLNYVRIETDRILSVMKFISNYFGELAISQGLNRTMEAFREFSLTKINANDYSKLSLKIREIENDYFEKLLHAVLDDKKVTYNNLLKAIQDNSSKLTKLKKRVVPDLKYYEEMMKLNNEENNTEDGNKHIENEIDSITLPKIRINSSLSDIVRIIESMKKSNVISSKTEVKQIVNLFNDPKMTEAKFNSTKSRLDKQESKSYSLELKNFVKLLTEKSYKGKDKILNELIKHLEKLYSP